MFAVFISLVTTYSDWELIGTIVKNVSLKLCALILGLSFLLMVFQAVRWRSLLLIKESDKPSYGVFFNYISVGYFANWLLPSSVGGDLIKTLALGKKLKAVSLSMAAIMFSRVLGISIITLMFWVSYAVSQNEIASINGYITTIIAFTGAIAVGTIVLLKTNLINTLFNGSKVRNIFDNVQLYLHKPKKVFIGIIFSTLIQTTAIVIGYYAYQAAGAEIPLKLFFLFIPLVFIATLVPISINGTGIREGVSILLFTSVTPATAEQVIAANILVYMVNIIQAAIGGVVFLFDKKHQ